MRGDEEFEKLPASVRPAVLTRIYYAKNGVLHAGHKNVRIRKNKEVQSLDLSSNVFFRSFLIFVNLRTALLGRHVTPRTGEG